MQIDVKEAARLLAVAEKTVLKWIREGSLPAQKISSQYRLNRSELLEYATAQGIGVSPDIFAAKDAEEGATPVAIADALSEGGIYYDVPGSDKAQVLASVVKLMKLPPGADANLILGVLLARESLGSTGIGDGIAIPHVRNPIVLHTSTPMITLCFLKNPIEFDSPDGRPVQTLFTLVSPTIRAHLSLLSKLTYLLRKPVFASVIAARADRGAILEAARKAAG